MEKKVKRSGRPPVGRMRQRLDATQLVTSPIIKNLISGEYPAHFVLLWLQLFSEFKNKPITPSHEAPDRRYHLTISMLRLMGYDLAEELEPVKNQLGAGRPAKRYRLVIPY